MREGTILVCPMAAQDVRSDDIIHSERGVQPIRNYVTLKTRVMDKSQCVRLEEKDYYWTVKKSSWMN